MQLLEVNLSAAVHIARDERLQQDVAVRIRVGAARTPRLVAAVAVAAARRGSRGGPVPVPVPVPCVALFFVVVHVVAEQASHAVRHRPGTSLRVGLRAGWTVHAVLQLRSYNTCNYCGTCGNYAIKYYGLAARDRQRQIVTHETATATATTTAIAEGMLVLVALAVAAAGSVRTPGVAYRSILGDPGMKWNPKADGRPSEAWVQQRPQAAPPPAPLGPRMQLFFYGLCSKAGYSNVSVLPEASDTCETRSGVIGMGAVTRVKAADCCAACLQQPWCLAWTRVGSDSCDLKDNALKAPPAPPAPHPVLGHPVPGFCGQTTWATGCNASASGAWKAKDHKITTLAQCIANCESCPRCNFASFSATNDGTGDCSWYASCDLQQHAGYMSVKVRNGSSLGEFGVRRFNPSQELPSPRYGNCIVDGKQTITANDNAAQVEAGVDAEWFAVRKEQKLGELCAVAAPTSTTSAAAQTETATFPSYFWTVMSQNGNDPKNVGTLAECLPYCYLTPPKGQHPNPPGPFGYPPAVNASFARCEAHLATLSPGERDSARRRLFSGLPQNQAKVMTGFTDGADAGLVGNFNWTFSLGENLAVPEHSFPMSSDLGIWSWKYDGTQEKGVVRMYQRISKDYPWLCTYFGADVGQGVKANEAYDGRGMMTEAPIVGDFLVRFFLNITKIVGGSWYAPNMEACWDQVTGKNCRPYGDTNRMVHQQVLLDYGHKGGGTGPPYHILLNGTKVHRSDPLYPKSAYSFYCCPCTSCAECEGACCDALSNPNGQSIYKIAPDPVWAVHGFPANASDGYTGNAKMHELNVGALWKQIWFPCMATEPIEIITVNMGPETISGHGDPTHDTEFFISDFDILVPDTPQ